MLCIAVVRLYLCKCTVKGLAIRCYRVICRYGNITLCLLRTAFAFSGNNCFSAFFAVILPCESTVATFVSLLIHLYFDAEEFLLPILTFNVLVYPELTVIFVLLNDIDAA